MGFLLAGGEFCGILSKNEPQEDTAVKKFLAIFLSLCLGAMLLAGCAGEAEPGPETQGSTITTPPRAPTGNHGAGY